MRRCDREVGAWRFGRCVAGRKLLFCVSCSFPEEELIFLQTFAR